MARTLPLGAAWPFSSATTPVLPNHFLGVEAAGREDASDVGGSFVLLAAKFRVRMNVAANFDEAGGKLGSNLLDSGGALKSAVEVCPSLIALKDNFLVLVALAIALSDDA